MAHVVLAYCLSGGNELPCKPCAAFHDMRGYTSGKTRDLEGNRVDPKELAFIAARVIDEKQGQQVMVADVSKVADITDFFVIATARNRRMVDSLIDDVEEALKAFGAEPISIEGREESTWALIDYGSVIVHIFQEEAREFYRLERLWGDAEYYDLVDGELIARDTHAPVPMEASRVQPDPYAEPAERS